ncbi:MAG: ABC-F family ATP-binding cassette domain-containing protein [Oligoflexia bacterium]|nr:ABC-F family ATP-binding cassette domain-containing protein [Oligoflexia bacterium]
MLQLSNLSKILGGQKIFSNVTFKINPGEKVGLVGANGTGKTTIFRLIIGEDRADEGQISLQTNTRLAYFSQSVGEMRGNTALQEVVSGHKKVKLLQDEITKYGNQLADSSLDEKEMNKILDRMGNAQSEFEKLGGYEVESNAEEILTGLGIKPIDHSKMVEDFSGGWKMRIALAKVLICTPDVILMDEPTNYLDMETILWLEEWLLNFKGAILMTTHDRDFMNKIVKKIVEISQGTATIYSGNYDFYLQEREMRKKQNEAEYNRQKDMLKKEEEFIARFQARVSHAAQVQSRVKKLEKIERVELMSDEDEMRILLPEIPRGGNDVIAIKNLTKTWTDSKGNKNEVFSSLSMIINRQERIAVVGINGAGKSTLLKILASQTNASSGEVIIGPSIGCGYFGQHTIEVLNVENTVFEELSTKLPDKNDAAIRNILAAFLFKGDEVFKKIRYLSGGEKARVVLASILSSPLNLLLLDEPTNHLDIKSREVLLDTLKRYQGTLLVVSHDRFFLRAIASKVLEIDKGSAYLYPGDYQEYLESKKTTKIK